MSIQILDTTLREGMQSYLGNRFSHDIREELAMRLYDFGLRRIELGSPAAGPEMQESIRKISRALPTDTDTYAHIRCHEADLATVPGEVTHIGIYFGTSEKQRLESHGKDLDYIISKARKIVERAKKMGKGVRYTAEDATRTPIEDLLTVYKEMDPVVDLIGIADTTGYATPNYIYGVVRRLKLELKSPIEFHGHNDRGLAIANAVAAIEAGADHVQVTLLGLGERNGITPLEGLLANLYFTHPKEIDKYKIEDLIALSSWFSAELGIGLDGYKGSRVPYNLPIVSPGSWADFAGVHAHAAMKNNETYHIFDPKRFGTEIEFPVNHPLTGKSAVRRAVEGLGHNLDDTQLKELTRLIKQRTFRWKKDDPVLSEKDVDKIISDFVEMDIK